MKVDMEEVLKILNHVENFPENHRLFLITDKSYIRIYYGIITSSWTAEEFYEIRSLGLDRGEILELFSKLEFIVNELIQLKILGANSNKGKSLDEILEYIDFFSRVRLLKKWRIIDNALFQKVLDVKQVRNGFAHAWGKEEVRYKGKKIENIFSEFKANMEDIWKNILEIYKEEQEKIDLKPLFEKLKELNPETNVDFLISLLED